MSQKKYQIFVSSTFRDLVEERQDAIRNILDLKHIPAGMELFPAADVNQLEYIKKIIDECDYYLLIMGGRYGSMDPEGVSYTEREYDYAICTNKIVLAFVHGDPSSISVAKSDVDPKAVDALNAFRDKVMKGRLVKPWSNRHDLEPLVLKALIHAFNDFPQTGWIRGDSAASDALLEQSNKALQENADLRTKLASFQTRVAPNIENIADFDDSFEFRFEETYRDRYGESTKTKRNATLTWKQIFLGVAGQLDQARTDVALSLGIKEALREAKVSAEPSNINETDKIRVKVQLVALGLIRTEVLQTTKGGVAEFLMLTDLGRAKFIEGMVIRVSPEEPQDD